MNASPIKVRLHQLNLLRAANGMPELKSWKASSAKLDEAISKLDASSQTEASKLSTPTNPIVEELVKQKHAARAKALGATFTLADLARELGIAPKVARAKLRRRPELKRADWTFTAAERSVVITALKGDARKK